MITEPKPGRDPRTGGIVSGARLRAVRVDDALWASAQEAAARNGHTISEILRQALRDYTETRH